MPKNNKEIASKKYVNKIFRSAQYPKKLFLWHILTLSIAQWQERLE